MCKVRLADIIKVNLNLQRSESQSAFNRIQSKHIDFVICKSDDMSIHSIIELDDKSYNQTSRQKRDAFVNNALKGAGIPNGLSPPQMNGNPSLAARLATYLCLMDSWL